jgi:5-methylcytosine-specific restriction endonuclease McrA
MAKQKNLGFIASGERAFMKRTARAYSNLANRLAEKRDKNNRIIRAGRSLPFTVDDLRAFLRPQFDDNWEAKCVYCKNWVDSSEFQLEHPHPLKRGGSLAISNLAVSCDGCNRTKGQLMPAEFSALMTGLRTFPEAAQKDILGRLRGQMRFLKPPTTKQEANSVNSGS